MVGIYVCVCVCMYCRCAIQGFPSSYQTWNLVRFLLPTITRFSFFFSFSLSPPTPLTCFKNQYGAQFISHLARISGWNPKCLKTLGF